MGIQLKTIKRTTVTALGATVLLVVPPSFAQSSAAGGETGVKIEDVKREAGVKKSEAELKKESGQVERIRVTGSHIKRIDVEGPSPVTVLEREDLDRTGYNSVSDVLRDMSQNSFGSLREQSGSNAADVAHVNLRGMGSARTLVLLNGRRLPTDAITGAVDLNMIPMASVERIEVLSDGASAIYGSDALGGVVNIITKKDFTGTEISYRESVPQLEGGKKMEVSLTSGLTGKTFQMTNVAYYRKNEAIFDKSRDYSNKGRSTLGSPGSYLDSSGTWRPDPNCPADRLSDPTPQGQFCRFDYTQFSQSLPDLEQVSLSSETNIDFTETMSMNFRLSGTQKNSRWQYAPAPDFISVPDSVASGLPGVDPGDGVLARYRLTELGNRVSELESQSYNALVGTKVALGDTWEVEADMAHNAIQKDDIGVSGYALREDLENAMNSGSFDPFAPEGQRGELKGYQTFEKTKSELSAFNMVASGELTELPTGPLGLAVGQSFTHQKYEDKVDEKSANIDFTTGFSDVLGSAGSSGEGQRDTRSIYTELSLPVTQKIEVQLAGRYDQYSDFGDTTNPKVGVRYQVSPQVMLRGSWGTGFKAPLMNDLYASKSIGFPTFIDHVACAEEKKAGVVGTPACNPAQYRTINGGNEGLKQEESENASVGMVVQPSRNFNLSTDVWRASMKNVVGLSLEDMTKAELAGLDPASIGINVVRDGDGYIEFIDAPTQNLSGRELSGLDIALESKNRFVTLKLAHSQMLYFRQEGFPGVGFDSILGQNGVPKWRNNITVSVEPTDNIEASLTARTIGGHEKAVKEEGDLPAYREWDFQFNLGLSRLGTLTAGVKNLMGTTPPLDDSNPNNQLDESLYDQIGRQYYMGYKASF